VALLNERGHTGRGTEREQPPAPLVERHEIGKRPASPLGLADQRRIEPERLGQSSHRGRLERPLHFRSSRLCECSWSTDGQPVSAVRQYC
jgi:hypothetical protein